MDDLKRKINKLTSLLKATEGKLLITESDNEVKNFEIVRLNQTCADL